MVSWVLLLNPGWNCLVSLPVVKGLVLLLQIKYLRRNWIAISPRLFLDLILGLISASTTPCRWCIFHSIWSSLAISCRTKFVLLSWSDWALTASTAYLVLKLLLLLLLKHHLLLIECFNGWRIDLWVEVGPIEEVALRWFLDPQVFGGLEIISEYWDDLLDLIVTVFVDEKVKHLLQGQLTSWAWETISLSCHLCH